MMNIAQAAGAPGNPVGGVVNDMFSGLMPEQTPARTGMSLPTSTSENVQAQFQAGITQAIAANGSTPSPAFADSIAGTLNQMFGSDMRVPFIDVSALTTEEQMLDQPVEVPIWAAPFLDGSERSISQYMPVWTIRGEGSRLATGFSAVASTAMINNIQLRLLQAERDATLRGLTSGLVGSSNKRALRHNNGGMSLPLSTGGYAPGSSQSLDMLRQYGSLATDGLVEKISYLGPVTQIARATEDFQSTAESIINYSVAGRGQIQQQFATTARVGDMLYYGVGLYSREELHRLGREMARGASPQTADNASLFGVSMAQAASALVPARNNKRKGGAYVGAEQRAAAADSFVQIRGWSTRESAQFMGDTSPVDSLKPQEQDRFYREREHRVAVEYRKYEYDAESDSMRLVDTLGEGVQEALNNVPSLVLENYLSLGAIYPVGVVKKPVADVSATQLLNSHYDPAVLRELPHVDIFHI